MKIVNAGYECIDDNDFINPLQKIERIARICYKSEDLITEDSYKKMTKVLLNKQHLAMFEHASLVFEVDEFTFDSLETAVNTITTRANANENAEVVNLCRIHRTRTWLNEHEERFVISANIRAFYEFFTQAVKFKVNTGFIINLYWKVNSKIDNLFEIHEYDVPANPWVIKDITDMTELTWPERLIHETFTVIFTCDRGVTHELVRMRDSSFAQESTRYCNYQLNKFSNEITVVKPCFWDENSKQFTLWQYSCLKAEDGYFYLLESGATAQEARSVLPTSVKADIALTTNLYEWRHIFNLRACDATGPAHPQMKEIMVPLFEEKRLYYPKIFGELNKDAI